MLVSDAPLLLGAGCLLLLCSLFAVRAYTAFRIAIGAVGAALVGISVHQVLTEPAAKTPATTPTWAMVSSIAAAIGVIVALYFHSKNLRLNRLSTSARLVSDYVARFESTEFRRQRIALASAIARKEPIDLADDCPLLDLFEEVGYMTRRGALDLGMVWNSFSWWLEPYFRGLKGLIALARTRTRTPYLYQETEWLHKATKRHTPLEGLGRRHRSLTDAEVREFLEREASMHA